MLRRGIKLVRLGFHLRMCLWGWWVGEEVRKCLGGVEVWEDGDGVGGRGCGKGGDWELGKFEILRWFFVLE